VSINANITQPAKAISIKNLNRKAFPVMNGKKNELLTISGKTGIRNKHQTVNVYTIFFNDIIFIKNNNKINGQ
jgi:hypothetical protein